MCLKSMFLGIIAGLLITNPAFAKSLYFLTENNRDVEIQSYIQNEKLSFVIFDDFDVDPTKLVYRLSDAIVNGDLLLISEKENQAERQEGQSEEKAQLRAKTDSSNLTTEIEKFARGEFKYQFRDSLIELFTSPAFNSEHTHFGVVIVTRENQMVQSVCQYRDGACHALTNYKVKSTDTGFTLHTSLPVNLTAENWGSEFDVYAAVVQALSRAYSGSDIDCSNQFVSVKEEIEATIRCSKKTG